MLFFNYRVVPLFMLRLIFSILFVVCKIENVAFSILLSQSSFKPKLGENTEDHQSLI